VVGQGLPGLLAFRADLENYVVSGRLEVGGVQVFVDHHPGGAAVSELVATENAGHSMESGEVVEVFPQPGPVYDQGVVAGPQV